MERPGHDVGSRTSVVVGAALTVAAFPILLWALVIDALAVFRMIPAISREECNH
ncbi:hypothetical protein ACQF36_35465 [Streptomyces sp. Marseille-Q5077]|uniref:hypothetical protein n=1 Tax=Streptomyces sp. Marseille-Q5077 TaxID=3418995 RepID=UPI003CFC369B